MISDDLIKACLAYDDCDPEFVLSSPQPPQPDPQSGPQPGSRPAMTIDDLIKLFLSFVEEDAEVEVLSSWPEFIIVHGCLYEEVIARGRDGVFVYAIPVQNEIPGEPREP